MKRIIKCMYHICIYESANRLSFGASKIIKKDV